MTDSERVQSVVTGSPEKNAKLSLHEEDYLSYL